MCFPTPRHGSDPFPKSDPYPKSALQHSRSASLFLQVQHLLRSCPHFTDGEIESQRWDLTELRLQTCAALLTHLHLVSSSALTEGNINRSIVKQGSILEVRIQIFHSHPYQLICSIVRSSRQRFGFAFMIFDLRENSVYIYGMI